MFNTWNFKRHDSWKALDAHQHSLSSSGFPLITYLVFSLIPFILLIEVGLKKWRLRHVTRVVNHWFRLRFSSGCASFSSTCLHLCFTHSVSSEGVETVDFCQEHPFITTNSCLEVVILRHIKRNITSQVYCVFYLIPVRFSTEISLICLFVVWFHSSSLVTSGKQLWKYLLWVTGRFPFHLLQGEKGVVSQDKLPAFSSLFKCIRPILFIWFWDCEET